MATRQQKREALSVTRLIHEVLVSKLGIPLHNIVNDATFQRFTQSKRPDILISNVAYSNDPRDPDEDDRFIENLVFYCEAKDITCKISDADWHDGIEQGKRKAPQLGLAYFGVTNCRATYFYNLAGERLSLNGIPISEFQTIDVLRIIKRRTEENPDITDISMGVDSLTAVSEAVFASRLWQLKNIYRAINFENNSRKIDFTVGLIAMKYYEEKSELEGVHDATKIWWSTAVDGNDNVLLSTLSGYIGRLKADESDFKEFSAPIDVVKDLISGNEIAVRPSQMRDIVAVIDSMGPLHGAGFDLFGAVYEAFANTREKKEFGEYFTRRNYAYILAKLLLSDRDRFDPRDRFTIIDPFCGTGGMLTESYRVLRQSYIETNTFNSDAQEFLSQECFYGVDLRGDNASRSRLNMFLVGDGHNHIYCDDSLVPAKRDGEEIIVKRSGEYDYVITNPPYGQGTIPADSVYLTSRRMEIASICRIIDLLKINGHACVITPDGVLENPSLKAFREELLLTCEVQSIISLPKFAFAPYTKEKTYAVYLKKRYERLHQGDESVTKEKLEQNGKYQKTPIWMYIVDNDGFANSDKRYPTRLRAQDQSWLHNELSGWVDSSGSENVALLEQRWAKRFDDSASGGTSWITENGEEVTLRKAGNVSIDDVANDGFLTLLPERYLRPYEPTFITPQDMVRELDVLVKEMAGA